MKSKPGREVNLMLMEYPPSLSLDQLRPRETRALLGMAPEHRPSLKTLPNDAM